MKIKKDRNQENIWDTCFKVCFENKTIQTQCFKMCEEIFFDVPNNALFSE